MKKRPKWRVIRELVESGSIQHVRISNDVPGVIIFVAAKPSQAKAAAKELGTKSLYFKDSVPTQFVWINPTLFQIYMAGLRLEVEVDE